MLLGRQLLFICGRHLVVFQGVSHLVCQLNVVEIILLGRELLQVNVALGGLPAVAADTKLVDYWLQLS